MAGHDENEYRLWLVKLGYENVASESDVWTLADFGLSKQCRLDSQQPTELQVVQGNNY